jgi:hypothetical protein
MSNQDGDNMSSVFAFKRPDSSFENSESQAAMTGSLSDDDKSSLTPIRTPAGDRALKNPESSMPRKLRALLSAVDNRAQTQVYCATLTAFGDVLSMFDALEEIGMVRFISDRPGVVDVDRLSAHQLLTQDSSLEDLLKVPPRAAVTAYQSPSVPVFQEPAAPAFVERRHAIPPEGAPPRFVAGQPASPANSFRQFNQQGPAPQDVSASASIEKVKTLMTDFVLTHFAADAMELTLAVDQIRTMQDLQNSLAQYEQIVLKIGKPGQLHLQAIKSQLQR